MKTRDPKMIANLDRQEKLRAGFERAYARMRRAVAKMESCRRALMRLDKTLAKLAETESPF